MTVTIANVEPVTIGESGTASASLNASTSNAPSGTSYQWTAEGANAGNVTFGSATSEDTTATFSADGSYTLRLIATSGSRSASDTVDVTVNPAPQNVDGVWTGRLVPPGGGTQTNFTLDLEQTGEDVTGTFTITGSTYPAEGTFNGTDLELAISSGGTTAATLEASVSGDAMTGTLTIFGLGGPTPITATRTPAP
jgi:hypothetical protein